MSAEPAKRVFADMEFTSIDSEFQREYLYENGFTLVIEGPLWLHVRPSGSHRIIDNRGYSWRIDMTGCKAIRWQVYAGKEPFVL